ARLLKRFETGLRATPGFAEMFARLDYPSCVATSSSRPRAMRSLQLLGVWEAFEARLFTASQVAHGKPAPDLFLLAAGSMGADPSAVLVIEDSLPGIAAAQAAGMHVLAYRGGAHLRDAPDLTPSDVHRLDDWAHLPMML